MLRLKKKLKNMKEKEIANVCVCECVRDRHTREMQSSDGFPFK